MNSSTQLPGQSTVTYWGRNPFHGAISLERKRSRPFLLMLLDTASILVADAAEKGWAKFWICSPGSIGKLMEPGSIRTTL